MMFYAIATDGAGECYLIGPFANPELAEKGAIKIDDQSDGNISFTGHTILLSGRPIVKFMSPDGETEFYTLEKEPEK